MATEVGEDFVHGARTAALVAELQEMGVRQASLLMRHSAREYAPGRHDLENPLTEEGRRLAREFGLRLAPELVLRCYASPVPRCQDTAELIHAAHLEVGGRGSGGCRPVEALGVFYVLDQMRMFKAMSTAGEGLAAFVDGWMEGRVPEDVMMAPRLAAQTLLRLLVQRLDGQTVTPALDLCVSHDLTLYLMRDVLLGRHRGDGDVLYLDGLALWRDGGAVLAATHDADATDVTALLG